MLIQVSLEASEHLSDHLRATEVRDGVGDRIMVFQSQQWREFLAIQFLHANTHVVDEHEVQKGLLFAIKLEFEKSKCAKALLVET